MRLGDGEKENMGLEIILWTILVFLVGIVVLRFLAGLISMIISFLLKATIVVAVVGIVWGGINLLL
ncbi:MAG: hypothetical protein KKG59_01965 [Nanoarchaeota archaeon]|nr:hypothetical protein [Nanoarchaeota archaeon]